jgi:ribosomal protein L11 methyltransferase
MNRRVLWKLSVKTSGQTEETVAEILAARFGQLASIYSDIESGETTVSIYLQTKPAWSKPARSRLAAALSDFQGPGLTPASPEITLTRLRPENWAESWKRHFKPLEIGRKLLIQPSWTRRRSKPGQATVVLDPGMSFGTGQHPTTSFCLRELARLRKPDQEQSFLDLGTGSGILAICAAKLGYEPVHALDLDPDSITVARANARLNKVSHRISFERQDLSVMPGHSRSQYSVVCANLISNLLLAQREKILARLRRGGFLVVAGILKLEFSQVRAAYEEAGLRLVRSCVDREWRSGCFGWRIFDLKT